MTEQITTVDELDALPIGSVVVDRDRDAWLLDGPGEWIAAETSRCTTSRLLRYSPLSLLYRPDVDLAEHDRQVAERAGAQALRDAAAYLRYTHDSETAIGNLLYRADTLTPHPAAPDASRALPDGVYTLTVQGDTSTVAPAAPGVSVSDEQLRAMGEAYAYDRWPAQTVHDDPDLIDVGAAVIREWLERAGITVTDDPTPVVDVARIADVLAGYGEAWRGVGTGQGSTGKPSAQTWTWSGLG